MTDKLLLQFIYDYLLKQVGSNFGEFVSVTTVAGALDMAPQDLMQFFSLDPAVKLDWPDDSNVMVGRAPNGVFGFTLVDEWI